MSTSSSVSRGDENGAAPRLSRGANLLRGLDSGMRQLVNASAVVSGCCLLVILLLAVADTVGRALWNAPVMGAVEISEALMAVTIFAALAYTQREGGHVIVDIFSRNYGLRFSRFVTIAALFLTFSVLAFLTWRTGITAERGWAQNEISAGYIPVPIWLAKSVAAVGLAVACLECLRELVRAVLGLHPTGNIAQPTDELQHASQLRDGI